MNNKIILLGDPHLGVHNGSVLFAEYQLSSLLRMVDYAIKNSITEIWCAGDVFEVRKSTNTEIFDMWKKVFFDLLKQHNIIFRVIVGNHDMFFKSKIHPNALTVHLDHYDNVIIHDNPYELDRNGNKFLFVPWMCKENSEHIIQHMDTTDANVVMGHFECEGADMGGSECTDGLPLSTFKKFDLALSGHFHIEGKYGNVHYIGTPYETTWTDFGEEKGFWVLDTKSLKSKKIRNDDRMFYKIFYKESSNMKEYIDRDYTDKYVRIIVEEREDYEKYESWLMKMELKKMKEMVIVDPFTNLSEGDSRIEFDGDITPVTTGELLSDYVDDVYPEKSKPLNAFLQSLHNEALSIKN